MMCLFGAVEITIICFFCSGVKSEPYSSAPGKQVHNGSIICYYICSAIFVNTSL